MLAAAQPSRIRHPGPAPAPPPALDLALSLALALALVFVLDLGFSSAEALTQALDQVPPAAQP
jgi:hypothetical protein